MGPFLVSFLRSFGVVVWGGSASFVEDVEEWRRGFFGGGGESRVVLGLLSCACCCRLSFLTHPRLILFYYIFIHPLPFLLVVMVRCGSFSEEGYYIKFIIPFK
jgi:hypothetical protein